MNTPKHLALLVLVLLQFGLLAQEKQAARSIALANFHNLYQVDSILYRSEQPDSLGLAALQRLGVRSIINFRMVQTDSAVVGSTKGIALIHYPMDARRIKQADVRAVMQLIQSAPKPVLIHCLHGSDRTGCMAAAYRMVFDAWTRQDAVSEFMQPQFGYHKFWFPGIKKLLQSMDIEQVRP